MLLAHESTLAKLVRSVLGGETGEVALDALAIDAMLTAETGSRVSRAAFAMALNILLFKDLLRRVPSGVADARARGEYVSFDRESRRWRR